MLKSVCETEKEKEKTLQDELWYAEIKKKNKKQNKVLGGNTKVIKERTSKTRILINKESSTQRNKIQYFFGQSLKLN